MANEEHLKILKQGVTTWNQWRKQNPGITPDLSKADLSGRILYKADLSRAILVGANLGGAILRWAFLFEAYLNRANLLWADLRRAELSGADLRRAFLYEVVLIEANLRGAILSGANIYLADLSRADLREADFSGAIVGWSTFGDIDLSVVKGLDTVKHVGPSTIGIDTIYRSKGNIPEVFLRGAGIPDTFMSFLASPAGQSIQLYSCFIGHSGEDRLFCDRLYANLRAEGVQAWYFPEDAKWGETVWGEIDRGIKIYDRLVVVCSENSLQSGPVLREIERALQREDQEDKNILFPIRIDNYIFDHWEHPRKADVVSKVVGDFQGWEQDADKYEAAFKKLLEALEAEG